MVKNCSNITMDSGLGYKGSLSTLEWLAISREHLAPSEKKPEGAFAVQS
jgi:hypothetical protein